jgi:hypothetical protein
MVTASRAIGGAIGLLVLSTAMTAQVKAEAPAYPKYTLSGTIVDSTGASIIDAAVVLSKCGERHAISEVRSRDSFSFAFFRLPDTCYDISAKAPGYKEATRRIDATLPSPSSQLPNLLPIELEALGPIPIPGNLPSEREQTPRKLKEHFTVQVKGHEFLLTVHSPELESTAFSVWKESRGGYRLVQRLEDTDYDTAEPYMVDGKPYLLLTACGRHGICGWALSRVGLDGHLTELSIPDIRQRGILKPGEELVSYELAGEDLGFVAYICIPPAMPCWLGDLWEFSEAWGDSGPQMIEGRFAIKGNALKVAKIRRKPYERFVWGNGPGIIR